jgi:putative endopeptidase
MTGFHPKKIARITLCAFAASLAMSAQVAKHGATSGGSEATGIDLKAMDTSVNPCQNFYQYACGTWRKDHPIPPDRARWSRFEELAEQNLNIEHRVLEKLREPSEQHSLVDREIGNFYDACMDQGTIDARGVKPLDPLLNSIDNMSSKKDLVPELARLNRDGVRMLFGFYVRADAKNAQDQIANIDQGGLGLPDRSFYLRQDPRSEALRKGYEDNIRTMFGLLAKAQGKTDADAQAQVEAVMKFETALAKASMTRVARRNPDNTYHKMTVAELSALSPDFEWKLYLTDVGLPPVHTLNVANPDFVKAMNTLIESTSLADLKTYLTWHVLETSAPLLPKQFRDANFQFFGTTLRGVKEQPVRWKQCVEATDHALGEALGQKFVQVAFSPASKAKALKLVGQIEHSMATDIETASWMTPATKKQALEKLGEVTNKIGYPDHWRDYSSVKIARNDFFGDVERARQFEVHRNLAKLGKPVDKSEWGMTPGTVNAYYNPAENNINFPAGILQPPFYNPKADDAVNYGAIGVVIGHELTHGFDDEGRRFDGEGNLRDWWTPADAKAFEARADCIAKEYSGFSPVPGVHLNGRLTLGENAADNGGIHLAYMALMNDLAGKVLPKEDGFTTQQQFFLGYAQIWCENTTEQAARLNAMTNPHSPGEFRVNGVLQNMPEFKEAFSCKAGEPMVSADACRVW